MITATKIMAHGMGIGLFMVLSSLLLNKILTRNGDSTLKKPDSQS